MKNEARLPMPLSSTTVRAVLPGVRAVLLAALLAPVSNLAQQAAADPVKPSPDPVKVGAELFAKTGCQFCHGPVGLGTERAPTLRTVAKHKTDEEIRHQIHDGGQMMPPFGEALTDDEIASLSAFLRAKNGWKLVPQPAAPSSSSPTASK